MTIVRLHKFVYLALLLLIGAVLDAQGIYKTKVYDHKEEDPAWKEVERDLNHLLSEVNHLSANLNVLNAREKELRTDILFNIRMGNDTLLTEKLKIPEARGILIRNDVEVDKAHRLTRAFKEVLAEKETLNALYNKRRIIEYDIPLYANLEDIHKEISKYGIFSGEEILVLESDSLAFGRELGKRITHSKIYLSDSDPMSLKTMYYLMQWDVEMEDIEEERSNEYYIVENTAQSTGVEDRIFDKIIFRNSFRQIEEKDAIIHSVKQSMNQQSELIICERFQEDCEASPCEGLMSRTDFKEAFEGHGLRLVESNFFHNSEGHRYWLFWLQLDR